MSFLRLPPDAPKVVRKQRKQLLVLIALGVIVAVAAAADFIARLKDPFAGLDLQATRTQTGATAQAPIPAQEASPSPAPRQVEVRVQLAAFSGQARANRLAKRATRAGFPSSVEPGTTADGKSIFRVQFVKPLEEEAARELVVELKAKMPKLQPILVRAQSKK